MVGQTSACPLTATRWSISLDNGRGNEEAQQQFNLYEMSSGKVSTLFTLTGIEKELSLPRFSPAGDTIAYMVRQGRSLTGLTYAIQLFDLKTHASRALFTGNLGDSPWTGFAWSPDGRMIAFCQKEASGAYISIPSVGQLWHGNIWVVSVPTGETRQATFVQGTAYRPVWSPDGRFLAFLTHDAQIGLTALDQPGVIWRAAKTPPEWPAFTSMLFLP